MDFRYNFGMKWSRGGVSVEKYVQGFQGFMQITPLRKVPLGGHSNLRDRPPLWILKSTATALYHNSHTRPALDHNSALLLLLQSLNLRHRSYRYSYKLHILMHARLNLTYARRVKFTLQLPFR